MYHYRAISVILAFVLSTIIGVAQHPISNALYSLMNTGNYKEANEVINSYSIKELAELPDSVLFDYYYLKAIISDNNGNESSKRKYLVEAKNICEKSQGIHSAVYLELCWAIGKSFENDGDTISAFEIYQAALVQSIGLYSLEDEDVKWQYEEIENKVIDWYKDDELRELMIKHREKLHGRYISNDVIQNDMEFYTQFYHDELLKNLILKADTLMISSLWEDAANLYIDIASKTQNNPIAKATLQELAATNYINMEDFQSAEELLLNNLRLLDTYRKTKVYRRTLSQLSNLYNSLHNYSKAKDYAGEAKFWYEESLDFSQGYILCLHRCAILERGNENYFLALLLEDVALQTLYRNNTGVNSGNAISRESFLANCLSSAALHYNQLGFHENAYSYLDQAIKIAETNNLDASTYYSNLADLCITTRNFDRAVLASENAYNKSDSENNKIQIGTILCFSQFLARQPISEKIIKESSQYLQSLVNNTFAFTSMEERRIFWSYFEYYFPLLNFLAYQSESGSLFGQIFNNILVEKGLLLRTANNLRNQILEAGTQEDLQMYDKMLQLRKLLSSLNETEARFTRSEIERIDKHLTRKFSNYANYANSNEVTWNDIQSRLDYNEIAIEFYNIPEIKWHEGGRDVDGKYRYCAITLRKGYEYPHIIPLFTDDKLQSISKDEIYDADVLYHLIWEPLEEELNDVNNIYFAADRELHKIGIEYAPMQNDKTIGDKYNLYRLSSTRVLAEKKLDRKADNAVLYGGLQYDIEKNDLIAESRSGNYHPTSASRAFSNNDNRYGVKYLPGTLTEIENIAQHFTNKPLLITDSKGTEESFKSLAGSSVDIIHLATHGFFWNEEEAKIRDYVSFLKHNDNLQSNEDKALMRSGLFFSGANIGLKGESLPDDVEDGVLTALELSNMNLGNVDMVVMSACESGLGEISGEGVFGLQRGFKLAGANTLLMSLWKVDDTATQLLMVDFYKNYLSGKSKQESLRLAQQSLRNNPEYAEPEYWAAFILLDALN